MGCSKMANEKRLIDVEQAKSATYQQIYWSESAQAAVRNFIVKLPKVDAVEVVHGRWLSTNDDNKKRCSQCDVIHLIAQYPHGQANYCPNCGAKMDGDRNGNTD